MDKSYKRRFQKFSESLSDPELINYARQNRKNNFSRKRKMPLKDMPLCCLSKKGLTTSFELRNCFKEKGDLSMQLSIQGYLQQRKRLNPEIFPYLNRNYLMDFYHSDEPKLWNGYLLTAVYGSRAKVPNSKENRETFRNSSNQHFKTGQVRALVSGMYDILNHFYLDIEIEHISVSENELAKRNLKHSPARLQKIRKNHPERYEHMKKKGKTTVRISRSTLPSGNELALVTDLPDTIATEELAGLYYQRWEIEKKYHTLKSKMKFESVTGKTSVYVYPDFWAEVLVYNMIQDIRNSADEEAASSGRKNGNKYSMHTNENIATGLFKEAMLKIFLEQEEKKRIQKPNELQAEIECYVVPKRERPGKERRKNISNKYKNNQKSSF